MGTSGEAWRFERELEETFLPEQPACRAGCTCWAPAQGLTAFLASLAQLFP